jgi:hypothetical protein
MRFLGMAEGTPVTIPFTGGPLTSLIFDTCHTRFSTKIRQQY